MMYTMNNDEAFLLYSLFERLRLATPPLMSTEDDTVDATQSRSPCPFLPSPPCASSSLSIQPARRTSAAGCVINVARVGAAKELSHLLGFGQQPFVVAGFQGLDLRAGLCVGSSARQLSCRIPTAQLTSPPWS